MALGKSGVLTLTSSVSGFQVRVGWSEDYDVVANTSTVTITSVQAKSSNWCDVTYYPDGEIRLNGVAVISMNSVMGTHNWRPRAIETWYSIQSSGGSNVSGVLEDIPHAEDGSLQISLEVVGRAYAKLSFSTISGDYDSGWGVTGSQTLILTGIPRASEIGATDSNIGSKSSIVVTKKSPAYTHSIQYQFGTLSGYVTSNGGVSSVESKFSETSIAFTIPESFYQQIPNSKTGNCTLICKTYAGNTRIGADKTTKFLVTAAEALCKPSVSGTIVDTNGTTKLLTGNANKLVKYFSDALCTIDAVAKNGSAINTKRIGGVAVSENARTINDVETGSVQFSATDSRGYSTSVTVNAELINYIKLTVNAQLNRTDPTSGNAKLVVRGNYFNGSFGAVSNTLICRYRIARAGSSYGSWINVTPTISGNSYNFSVNLSGLDYQYSYSVQVQCYDKLITLSPVATVGQGIPVVDWGSKDFRFNVPFLIPASCYGSALPGDGKMGQVFFLRNNDGTYSIRIYNGTSW